MEKMLNISDRTNAVLHALALGAGAGGMLTAAGAAERLGVSPTYLAKALQPLAKSGILVSRRGPAGGFELARDASLISCLEVMELLDGPMAERECLFVKAVCESGECSLGALCRETAQRVRKIYSATSIADLALNFREKSNQTEL